MLVLAKRIVELVSSLLRTHYAIDKPPVGGLSMADEVRFELTEELPPRQFSRRKFAISYNSLQHTITQYIKWLQGTSFCHRFLRAALICREMDHQWSKIAF